MPGARELVQSKVVIAVDATGSIVPIKNTLGALTRQAVVESFVRALDPEHRQMLRDALSQALQFEHGAVGSGDASHNRG